MRITGRVQFLEHDDSLEVIPVWKNKFHIDCYVVVSYLGIGWDFLNMHVFLPGMESPKCGFIKVEVINDTFAWELRGLWNLQLLGSEINSTEMNYSN